MPADQRPQINAQVAPAMFSDAAKAGAWGAAFISRTWLTRNIAAWVTNHTAIAAARANAGVNRRHQRHHARDHEPAEHHGRSPAWARVTECRTGRAVGSGMLDFAPCFLQNIPPVLLRPIKKTRDNCL